ncbi:MAG: hypothetical protein OXF74_02435 [Rhodobacteraceae bacterium]|nr:hypothetical protein [Paracoccaceae bacterium]
MLVRIADDADHLRDIFDLDQATNDRLLAENGRLPGIGIDELVFSALSMRPSRVLIRTGVDSTAPIAVPGMPGLISKLRRRGRLAQIAGAR